MAMKQPKTDWDYINHFLDNQIPFEENYVIELVAYINHLQLKHKTLRQKYKKLKEDYIDSHIT